MTVRTYDVETEDKYGFEVLKIVSNGISDNKTNSVHTITVCRIKLGITFVHFFVEVSVMKL